MPTIISMRHRDPDTREFLGADIFIVERAEDLQRGEIRVRHRDDGEGIVLLVTYTNPITIARLDIQAAGALRDALTELLETQYMRKTKPGHP